ncbi:hypothetical protein ACFOVU_09440 [Nocardiopsis sediminis]|uniref:Uncharacterized protein n=1 Tax=Nocardiopsis sediminis TaxID=1778267 RepID=A0ABV8FN74_9ACTN
MVVLLEVVLGLVFLAAIVLFAVTDGFGTWSGSSADGRAGGDGHGGRSSDDGGGS